MIAGYVGGQDNARLLNMLLVGGLVSINLVAFGVAFWLATRDILAEVTGEVRADWTGAPDAVVPANTPQAKSAKRSSLSKQAAPLPLDELPPDLSLPLPMGPMKSPPSSEVRPAERAPVPTQIIEAPLTSPSTEPLPAHEADSKDVPPANSSQPGAGLVETGPAGQSP